MGILIFIIFVFIYVGVEIFGVWGFVIGLFLVVFLKVVYEIGVIKKIRENFFMFKKE